VPLRLCLGLRGDPPCGTLTDAPGSRCPDHQRRLDTLVTRDKRRRRPYSRAELDRRAAAVAEWIAQRGYWCPGWGVPEHQAADLTADHVIAVAAGGPEDGPLTVLCRACNGRKGSSA
jgi:5-methylcytosine-specific restriction enzyme A